jgi:hypothetical protein
VRRDRRLAGATQAPETRPDLQNDLDIYKKKEASGLEKGLVTMS